MNNKNEFAEGFAWRRLDGTTEPGNWVRDLLLGIALALAVSLMGMIVEATTPEEFARFLQRESAKYQRVIQAAGIKATL